MHPKCRKRKWTFQQLINTTALISIIQTILEVKQIPQVTLKLIAEAKMLIDLPVQAVIPVLEQAEEVL